MSGFPLDEIHTQKIDDSVVLTLHEKQWDKVKQHLKDKDAEIEAAEELLREVLDALKGPIIKTSVLVKIKIYLNRRL